MVHSFPNMKKRIDSAGDSRTQITWIRKLISSASNQHFAKQLKMSA